MTLILGLANREFALLASDRRLTRNGRLEDDESNKATVFVCDDGRFAAAFTGLARSRDFSTDDWLVDALAEAAKPSYLIGEVVVKLGELARHALNAVRVDARAKRLSVLLVGYHFAESPPRAYCFLVSNYDVFGQTPRQEASAEFTVSYLRETRPAKAEPALVVAVGHEPAVPADAMAELGALLKDRKPAEAVRDKALSIVRQAAASRVGRDVVGKQATSVVLPSDPAQDAVAAYHPGGIAMNVYLPNHVVATREVAMSLKGIELRTLGTDGAPVPYVPCVGRNARCPCGSGRKYKRCHGALPSLPGWTMRVGPQFTDSSAEAGTASEDVSL